MGADDGDAQHLRGHGADGVLMGRIADAHVSDDRQDIHLAAHRFYGGLRVLGIQALDDPAFEIDLRVDVGIAVHFDGVPELLPQDYEAYAAALAFDDGIGGKGGRQRYEGYAVAHRQALQGFHDSVDEVVARGQCFGTAYDLLRVHIEDHGVGVRTACVDAEA